MKVTADRWEVLLHVPRDIGDLGLHQPEDLAAAHFRRQLAEELGQERAAQVGPDAEQQFRKARAAHAGRPVLWGGFIMTATPAAAGLPVDTSDWPADPAERARLAELAATQDGMLISLTVGVRELSLPDMPLAPSAVLSRSIKARFGDDAQVHLVTYGDVPGVAVVRTQEIDPDHPDVHRAVDDADDARDGSEASEWPVGEHILAEVNLLFPDDDALVTVTAVTPNYGAVNDAVLMAGSIARGIQVRPADPEVRAAREVEAGSGEGRGEVQSGEGRGVEPAAGEARPAEPGAEPAAAATPGADAGAAVVSDPVGEPALSTPATEKRAGALAVVLPDGQHLPEGMTLLGRGPRRTAELPADHTVTLRDASISRTHLALRVTGGTVTATDLHSTNGTLVRRRDGAVVALGAGEETELVAGDEVNLGAALLRVVEQS